MGWLRIGLKFNTVGGHSAKRRRPVADDVFRAGEVATRGVPRPPTVGFIPSCGAGKPLFVAGTACPFFMEGRRRGSEPHERILS